MTLIEKLSITNKKVISDKDIRYVFTPKELNDLSDELIKELINLLYWHVIKQLKSY